MINTNVLLRSADELIALYTQCLVMCANTTHGWQCVFVCMNCEPHGVYVIRGELFTAPWNTPVETQSVRVLNKTSSDITMSMFDVVNNQCVRMTGSLDAEHVRRRETASFQEGWTLWTPCCNTLRNVS